MWAKTVSGLLASLLIAACAGGGERQPGSDQESGAATAEADVSELVDHLNAGEFAAASHLALPGHAALASLAEGATPGQVAEALRSGDAAVAANFWSGFAQGTGTFLLGPVGYQIGEPASSDGLLFEVVVVNSPAGGRREVLVREQDGYRIDLFASFGSGLAPRMIQPVERLLLSETDEARLILSRLREIVPSLLAASERSGLPPEIVQGILQLVEVITRVG